jgi:catechol 2,3-dioxygenase-like lactoylglutathione lyase family enzyme
VNRVDGLEGVRAQIAILQTPDGHGRFELTKFHTPSTDGGYQRVPAAASGIRHVAFAVDNIDAVLARLRARGAELVGEPPKIVRNCRSRTHPLPALSSISAIASGPALEGASKRRGRAWRQARLPASLAWLRLATSSCDSGARVHLIHCAARCKQSANMPYTTPRHTGARIGANFAVRSQISDSTTLHDTPGVGL